MGDVMRELLQITSNELITSKCSYEQNPSPWN